MREETKIAFVHNGNSWYLPYVLNQARAANGNSDVVLIGSCDAYERREFENTKGAK
jgi:hypothetical protein